MSALQDAKGRWLPEQMLEDHEILFVERFEQLGRVVRWIARPEYVEGTGRKASNNFIWLNNDSEVCELKNVSAKYASIKERIRHTVLKAEKHDVFKDVFIIDLAKARLSEKLRKQLSRYNANVKSANIRRLFVLSDSGTLLIEIILERKTGT